MDLDTRTSARPAVDVDVDVGVDVGVDLRKRGDKPLLLGLMLTLGCTSAIRERVPFGVDLNRKKGTSEASSFKNFFAQSGGGQAAKPDRPQVG